MIDLECIKIIFNASGIFGYVFTSNESKGSGFIRFYDLVDEKKTKLGYKLKITIKL